ncbi:MAG TPA: chemotaxis protein CheW [Longimicrobiaceae bacterium]|nr:chemotaxis protein CheW [Longimicrobiaceae bacterium]
MSEVLVFTVNGHRCGLPLEHVREILRAVAVTPLPGAPAVVQGVIDVRGVLVPVIGLRERFRLPVKEIEPSDRFVVAMAGERPVVLVADSVAGVVALEPTDARELNELVSAPRYVSGVGRLPDGLVLIQDLRRFLSRDEAVSLDEAMSESGRAGGGG